MGGLPNRISPVFITEIYRAQQRRPSISDDAVIFVSLADTIVSLQAIGTAVSSGQIRLDDGKHQLFAAYDRDEAIDAVLDVLPG